MSQQATFLHCSCFKALLDFQPWLLSLMNYITFGLSILSQQTERKLGCPPLPAEGSVELWSQRRRLAPLWGWQLLIWTEVLQCQRALYLLVTFNILLISLQEILEFSINRGNENMLEEVMERQLLSLCVCCVYVLIVCVCMWICMYLCVGTCRGQRQGFVSSLMAFYLSEYFFLRQDLTT